MGEIRWRTLDEEYSVQQSITEEGWRTINEDILRLEVAMDDG